MEKLLQVRGKRRNDSSLAWTPSLWSIQTFFGLLRPLFDRFEPHFSRLKEMALYRKHFGAKTSILLNLSAPSVERCLLRVTLVPTTTLCLLVTPSSSDNVVPHLGMLTARWVPYHVVLAWDISCSSLVSIFVHYPTFRH